jgi:uncharacterized protein (TIGR02270 family)
MPLSREQFAMSIHEECLEEAAFLYQQRRTLLAAGGLTRVELGRQERRLQAFIDALVEGGEAAVTLCLERADQEDAGESYATVRLLSRIGLTERLAELLRRLQTDVPEQVSAVRDGLCHEMPEGSLPEPRQLSAESPPEAAGLLAAALGHRRRGQGEWVLAQLRQALGSGSWRGATAYTWTLGRLRPPGAEGLLSRCLEMEDPEVRSSAAVALLRLGGAPALRSLLAPRTFPAWACLPMGLSGGPAALPRLKAFADRDENATEALLALGLLGDISAVPELLTHLGHPSHAPAAAESLELLTGSGLVEPVMEPDAPPDEDELFEEEMIAAPRKTEFASGNVPVRPSRRADEWRHWWKQHSSRLPTGHFLRFGEPCSPDRFLDVLAAGVGTGRLRQLLADEWVIRYGLDVGFEPDALLSAQERALHQGRAQLAQHLRGFNKGRWYLGGTLA